MQGEQRELHNAAKALLKKAGRATSAQDDLEMLSSLADYHAELANLPKGKVKTDDLNNLNKLIKGFENRVLPSTETTRMSFLEYESTVLPKIADEFVRGRWEALLSSEETRAARLFDAQNLLGHPVATLEDAHRELGERFHQEFNQPQVSGRGASFDFVRARDLIKDLPSLFSSVTPGVEPPSVLTKVLIESADSPVGLNKEKLESFFKSGSASGAGMNCLLDSLKQVSENAKLPHPTSEDVRNRLVAAGLAADGQPIDALGITGEAIARQYGVRLTIFVQKDGGLHTVNPPVGNAGAPEVYVRLDPTGAGHFTPLYLKPGTTTSSSMLERQSKTNVGSQENLEAVH